MRAPYVEFDDQARTTAARLIELAFAEDFGDEGDLTSRWLIPPTAEGTIDVVARQTGVISGQPVAEMVFAAIDRPATWEVIIPDGEAVRPGDIIARVSGPVRSLLGGERTALNFLGHLSGVATLTQQFVGAVAGTSAQILDTRKTTPGWRRLEKYAVRCGGGVNHRMGLFDACMVKDNHLSAWQAEHRSTSIAEAVRELRKEITASGMVAGDGRPPAIIVETDHPGQLSEVLPAFPDIVLLDNMSSYQLAAAVSLRNEAAPSVLLEASGGITLDNVGEVARTGVDRISIGALTHSAVGLDIGFDWSILTRL